VPFGSQSRSVARRIEVQASKRKKRADFPVCRRFPRRGPSNLWSGG